MLPESTSLQNPVQNADLKQLHRLIATECNGSSTKYPVILDKKSSKFGLYKSIVPIRIVHYIAKISSSIAAFIELIIPIKCLPFRIINSWATNKVTQAKDLVTFLKYKTIIPQDSKNQHLTIADFKNIHIPNNRYISNHNIGKLNSECFLKSDKIKSQEFDKIVAKISDLILDYSGNSFLKKILAISTISKKLGSLISTIFNKTKTYFLKENIDKMAKTIAFNLLKFKLKNTEVPTIKTIESISADVDNLFNTLKSQNKLQSLKSIDELLAMPKGTFKIENPNKSINLTELFEKNIKLFDSSIEIKKEEKQSEYIQKYADNFELFIFAIITEIISHVRADLTSSKVGILKQVGLVKKILA